ncbi:MAG: metalloregulator ArsR/SmtB family transcription factor [Deltaproteobacteria bacterium]|nr:metalloregulator ArsR/SmtB family transcription factor [Deltaproteobacteria bacterium]
MEPRADTNGAATQQPGVLGSMLGWMSSLADPTRARALRLVESHELSVAELCSILQAPQSTVSRHLKVLSDEGWVAARPEGTSRLYRMSGETLDPAARRLWSLLREQAAGTVLAEQDDQRLQSVLAERRTQSQAFFSSSAGEWDRLRSEMFGDRFDRTALAALLDESWTVGDLGCGTGQWAEVLAPFVHRVIAVDSSAAMLKAARQRVSDRDNVELRRGELEALPIDEASLDAATLCLVLHHVPDPPTVLREVARVLVPGGRLLIVDMFRHDRIDYQRQMGHVWLGFERLQLEEWLRDAGFAAPRIVPLPPDPRAKGPALFAAAVRREATERRNGTHPGNSSRRASRPDRRR